jgi:hypothetical protein
VAGLVLLGKPVALRRCFPMTRVDYIRVPGREWVPDPDRRFDTVELRDPLFRLIRRAQAAILDDLPKAFGLAEGELQRQDSPLVPQRVIREAVVNALMHRSYRLQAPVQIIRYSNRLEIRNPGFSLKSPDHLGEPGSVPRNPKVAAALYDTRFAETKGSGVRVMREMCERAGLAPPLFESDRGQDQFTLPSSSTTSWGRTTWPGWPVQGACALRRRGPRPGGGPRGRGHGQPDLPRDQQGGHPCRQQGPAPPAGRRPCSPRRTAARPPGTSPPLGCWATGAALPTAGFGLGASLLPKALPGRRIQ